MLLKYVEQHKNNTCEGNDDHSPIVSLETKNIIILKIIDVQTASLHSVSWSFEACRATFVELTRRCDGCCSDIQCH